MAGFEGHDGRERGAVRRLLSAHRRDAGQAPAGVRPGNGVESKPAILLTSQHQRLRLQAKKAGETSAAGEKEGEKEGEGEEAEDYKLAREYNWTVKNKASKNYEENYLFVFRDDAVTYNELETRVRLSRRRAKEGAPRVANSRLVVKPRPFNEDEAAAQEERLLQLAPPAEEDEDEEAEAQAQAEAEADEPAQVQEKEPEVPPISLMQRRRQVLVGREGRGRAKGGCPNGFAEVTCRRRRGNGSLG